MRSGTGFGLATVIMDRFLDVWFVALFFFGFKYFGISDAAAPAKEYLILSAIVLGALVLVILLRNILKKLCLGVSGIFNETIKLDFLTFFWSLINTFKDLKNVKIVRLIINTVIMWGAYISSYYTIAECISRMGTKTSLYNIFSLLFANNGISGTTLMIAAGTPDKKIRVILVAWLLLPIIAMLVITLLPRKTKDAISDLTGVDKDTEYANLLPQLDRSDRALFLSRYFGLENSEYLGKFLEVNRNISIIQDYSAGSNATTMLCMDSHGKTFFRKYAFGYDGEKLAVQLAWIKQYCDKLPLCTVLADGVDDDCCWYDMEYDPSAIDFFRFIHSNPVEASSEILKSILDCLSSTLYENASPAEADTINSYIDLKVISNLNKIRESRIIKDLLSYDTLIINGVEYKNLPAFEGLLSKENLLDVFANDKVTSVHGDLTIENIICRTDKENSWYIIDPNPGNVLDSPYLDYAKLLQSLRGSYEFMMMTPSCLVTGNHIDYQMTRSGAYDALLKDVREYFEEHFGKAGTESIYMHEIVHWLRLMPYKLTRDRKRAPMFYAGLIIALNEMAQREI